VEITSIILAKKDTQGPGFILDKIVDQTGSKGTGRTMFVSDLDHLQDFVLRSSFELTIPAWFVFL
jgi:6-phosphogluconate dehydrogenase